MHAVLRTKGFSASSGASPPVRHHLPDVQVLLAHAQQHRDVLLGDHMVLAEAGVLIFVLDDLGHVVAEHVTYGFFCLDKLHGGASQQRPHLSTNYL